MPGWDELQPDRLNANRGTERGREFHEKAIRELGIAGAIDVDGNGNIIGGNKTAEIAAELGYEPLFVKPEPGQAVVIVHEEMDLYSRTDPRARDLATSLNRVAEVNIKGGWAEDMLRAAEQLQGATAHRDFWWPEEREALATSEAKREAKEEDQADAEQTPLDVQPRKARQVTRYVVVVTCDDANAQADLIDLCEERGWKWRNAD